MSLYLFDTDLLTLFCDGHPTVCDRAAQHALDELATSVVTIEEQLTGWYTLLRQAKSDRQLVTAYDGMTYSICNRSGHTSRRLQKGSAENQNDGFADRLRRIGSRGQVGDSQPCGL